MSDPRPTPAHDEAIAAAELRIARLTYPSAEHDAAGRHEAAARFRELVALLEGNLRLLRSSRHLASQPRWP